MSTAERARTAELTEEARTPKPAIWVGADADYHDERRFGDWVEAALPVREVMTAVGDIVDRTPDGLGQRWSVHELRDFGVWRPTDGDSLSAILSVARGIKLFGLAYSGLVSVVGADSPAADFDRFAQTYVGDWPTLHDFARQVTSDSGWHEHLDRLPRHMRQFVRIDYGRVIRDVRRELAVVRHDQGYWLYDPRIW